MKVTPRASRNEIIGWSDDGILKIKLNAPPVDGKANRALVEFLSEESDIPKSSFSIVRGESARLKRIRISRTR